MSLGSGGSGSGFGGVGVAGSGERVGSVGLGGQGSRFMGWGCEGWGLGVEGLGLRVESLGYGGWGSWFRVSEKQNRGGGLVLDCVLLSTRRDVCRQWCSCFVFGRRVGHRPSHLPTFSSSAPTLSSARWRWRVAEVAASSTLLTSRTTAWQKCGAAPRRARISGS